MHDTDDHRTTTTARALQPDAIPPPAVRLLSRLSALFDAAEPDAARLAEELLALVDAHPELPALIERSDARRERERAERRAELAAHADDTDQDAIRLNQPDQLSTRARWARWVEEHDGRGAAERWQPEPKPEPGPHVAVWVALAPDLQVGGSGPTPEAALRASMDYWLRQVASPELLDDAYGDDDPCAPTPEAILEHAAAAHRFVRVVAPADVVATVARRLTGEAL